MSCPCTVCALENVEEINELIVTHTPLRDIASRIPGTSRSALGRHRKHVGGLLVRAVARIAAPHVEAAEVEAFEDSLLAKVSRLEADARRIGLRAEAEGDLRAALVANAGLLNVVKMLHELLPSNETEPAVEVRFLFPPSGLHGETRTTLDPNEYMPENVVPAQGDVAPTVAYPSPPPSQRTKDDANE